MMKASFGSYEFNDIEGYRITCRVTPNNGFGGEFFVYIEERRQAQTAFTEKVVAADPGSNFTRPVKGELVISDEDRSYHFRNIELRHAEFEATRRERRRFFEFHYDPNDMGAGSDPISINGLRSKELHQANLGEDYMGGLGASRHLLGFRAYVGASSSTIVRFSNPGCLSDSFLQKAVAVSKEIAGGNVIFPHFTIKFSQGDFQIDHNEVEAMYVEESYGSMLHRPIFSINKLVELSSGGRPPSIRLESVEHTGNDLLLHETDRHQSSVERKPGTVETTTVMFSQAAVHADFSVR